MPFKGMALKRDNKPLIALVYCLGLLVLGLCIASLGPAMVSLAAQIDVPLDHVGFVSTFRSIAYLLGSFGGPLFDKPNIPGHWLLGGCMLLCSLGTFFVPFANTFTLLALFSSAQGAAMGFLDTGANLLLIFLFSAPSGSPHAAEAQKLMGRYMQTMHFSFALGAVMAPLLMRLFEQVEGGRSTYDGAFWFISAATLAVAIALLILQSPKPREQQKEQEQQQEAGEGQQDKQLRIGEQVGAAAPSSSAENGSDLQDLTVSQRRWRVVVLVAVLLGLYVGCEAGFGIFTTAYAYVNLGQTEADSQMLTAVYWGALCVGRASAIWISGKVAPRKYLQWSMGGSAAAAILCLIGKDSVPVFWGASVIFGFCMAPIFPSAIAWAESVFPVQGKDGTVFVIGSAAGEMAIPALISGLFGSTTKGDLPADTSGLPSVGPLILPVSVAVACSLNWLLAQLLFKKGDKLKVAIGAEQARKSGGAAGAGAAQDEERQEMEEQQRGSTLTHTFRE